MTRRRRLMLLLPVGLVGLALACSAVGPTPIPLADLLQGIGVGNSTPSTEATIYREFRLPRVVAACVVGAALAVAGVGFQGVFRNPLAEPYVIGASSGAALGAACGLALGLPAAGPGLGAAGLLALVGALAVVAVVFAIGACADRASSTSLLLAGVAVGSMVNGGVSLLMVVRDDRAATILSWLMGSLAGSRWGVVGPTAVLALVGAGGVWLLARPLDVFALGDEAAEGLGLHPFRVRVAALAAASLATAAAVSCAGIVGFVGLVAPHVARRLVGDRHGVLVPAAGVVGAASMLLADVIARTVTAPAELPIGIVTSLVGGPFFLGLLLGGRRRHGLGE